MDLTYLMLTGGLSGLVSVLLHSIIASARTSIRPGAVVPPMQASDAVVDVPWWVRGLSFGSLCWVSFAVPSVVGIALTRALPVAAIAEAALRWATTSVIAGLVCAWSWERML
jgi:hypothetical protein